MAAVQVFAEGDAGEYERLLAQAAEAALAHQNVGDGSSLTIVLSDDAQLRELNQKYRGIDEPTDVLSFPADETDPESGAPYLGDVLISRERAIAQAAEGGHSLQEELQLLAVHAVLHLLGHDHAGEEDKAAMWAAQGEILQRLGNRLSPL
jgi:probable rRNA maturation factor